VKARANKASQAIENKEHLFFRLKALRVWPSPLARKLFYQASIVHKDIHRFRQICGNFIAKPGYPRPAIMEILIAQAFLRGWDALIHKNKRCQDG
jgi:hypothetical protein